MSNQERNKDLLALEEFKLLQEIAQNQEELRLKLRGWCVALVTALSVASLSKEIDLSGTRFFLISIMVVFMFLWLDVLYRVAQDRALKRAKVVEECLCDLKEYKGPCIRQNLSLPNSVTEQLQSLNNIRVYSPYLLLVMITIVVTGI